MSFMKPEFYEGLIQIIRDTSEGDIVTPNCFASSPEEASEAFAVDLEQVETREGFCWRLSASGYLDSTEWTFAETLEEAVSDCLGMFGDGLDLEDFEAIAEELEDFEAFKNDYLLGLAFTASRYATSDSEPEPLFGKPGLDIADCVDVESEVWDRLSDEVKIEILSDLINFYCSAKSLIEFDLERAGSDFHLSRNGHGAGFFDGDWKHGSELHELSKPYGAFELVSYGKHIDKDFEGFEGPDVCLETSFFEYGLIWKKVSETEYRFIYGSDYEGDEPTRYHWADVEETSGLDFQSEFGWVANWTSELSSLGIETDEDLEEWLSLPFPQRIYDLVSLFGSENIFGSDYCEGTLIVNDDTQSLEVQR